MPFVTGNISLQKSYRRVTTQGGRVYRDNRRRKWKLGRGADRRLVGRDPKNSRGAPDAARHTTWPRGFQGGPVANFAAEHPETWILNPRFGFQQTLQPLGSRFSILEATSPAVARALPDPQPYKTLLPAFRPVTRICSHATNARDPSLTESMSLSRTDQETL